MDRRAFIRSGVAAATLASVTPALAQAPGGGDAALNALFDRIFADDLDHSPELATSLGLDKGARAVEKTRLSERTAAARADELARTRRWTAELNRFAPAQLSTAAETNRQVVLYSLIARTVAPARFGLDTVIRPYRIFQQGGAYYEVPDFLNDSHVIANAADCEAYLARLDAFAGALDQDLDVQRAQAARGYVAPDFALDLTLGQMEKVRGTAPGESNFVRSLATRAAAKGVAGDWSARATAIVQAKVYPALDRQIALVRELRARTQPGAGVWRVPQGDAIYAAALEQATTTTMTPAEVHAMGVTQVAEISARLDTILRGQGMTGGSVAERLGALNKDPSQLYPDSAEGRAALFASLNDGIRRMYAQLPRDFAHVPGAPLEIRAVPVEIQDGASNGYYKRAALDGSRPAIYFINLKDVGDWPKYSLPSLTFHEGVPGHHLQISLAQESRDIPPIRKIGFYSAYAEGWALYAEQLADELGQYQTPLERAGYLQSFLFRAARLVADTGIHTLRWSREQATQYLVDTVGFARARSQREVERYCTQPGQACSYKVGHGAWTAARARSEAQLGARFDLKRFHEVLIEGAMPLTVLQQRIEARTRAQMA